MLALMFWNSDSVALSSLVLLELHGMLGIGLTSHYLGSNRHMPQRGSVVTRASFASVNDNRTKMYAWKKTNRAAICDNNFVPCLFFTVLRNTQIRTNETSLFNLLLITQFLQVGFTFYNRDFNLYIS